MESDERIMNVKPCDHVPLVRRDLPMHPRCDACVAAGDTWVHLRMCMHCGSIGCCDDSKNKHASKHHAATGHAVIQSFEPGESWMWCYEHKLQVG